MQSLLKDGKLPRFERKRFFADSTAIVAGAAHRYIFLTTPYIESSAGVAAGGRTGLTAVVVGLLFIACLFLAPLAAVSTWFCNSARHCCLLVC